MQIVVMTQGNMAEKVQRKAKNEGLEFNAIKCREKWENLNERTDGFSC